MAISLIQLDGIILDHPAKTRDEAIVACGRRLQELGAVKAEYIEKMLTREAEFSTYLGNEVAMPHGDFEARNLVEFDQLTLMRLENQVQWSEGKVKLLIGLAVRESSQVELLGSLSEILTDPDLYQRLMTSKNPQELLDVLLAGIQPSSHK